MMCDMTTSLGKRRAIMGKQRSYPEVRGRCAYCDINPATSDDHVVPKLLFPKRHPGERVTVRACADCNQRKGLLDHNLRDFLLADIDTAMSPVAATLRLTTFKRSFAENKSTFLRKAFRDLRITPVFTPPGISLGNHPMYKIDDELIRSELIYIARGLHFKFFKRAIPQDYAFEIRRVNELDASKAFQAADDPTADYRRRCIGEGVFDTIFSDAPEHEFVTRWLFSFYNAVFFTVSTRPPDVISHQPWTG
jgi:hypothetical protein